MDVELAKNRSGVWELRWSEKLPDGTWRTRTKSTRHRHRPDAETYRAVFVSGGVPQPIPTLADLCQDYLNEHCDRNGITASQRWTLDPVRSFFGSMYVSDVTPELTHQYARKRQVQDGTLRRELGALVTVIKWAERNQKVNCRVPHITLPQPSPGRTTFLTEEEEAEYYAHAMGISIGLKRLSRVTRYIGLALDTAARRAAIQSLTWDRVDLRAGLIDYRVPGQRQTKKRRVVVPISDRLYPLLNRAKKEQTSPYVIDPGSIRAELMAFFQASPFPHIRTHDMRRTWATLSARAGVDLWEIAGVLGDTIEVVTRHYVHHCPGHLKGAVNKRWR